MDQSKINRQIVRVKRLADEGNDDDLKYTTPAERVGMMWQLALDAWAFMGEPVRESRLPRHVMRIVKNKRAAGRPKDFGDIARLEANE